MRQRNELAEVRLKLALLYSVKNAFGDVVALYSIKANGPVAKYVYDAWGNCKVYNASGVENTTATFVGNINPIRYRSYYWDSDVGLYYLHTRWYDPEIGRFVNLDQIEYLNPQTVNGLNLYAYCWNDPVNYYDPFGHIAITISLAALALLALGFIVEAETHALQSAITGIVDAVGDIIGGIGSSTEADDYEQTIGSEIVDETIGAVTITDVEYSYYAPHRKKGTTNRANRKNMKKGKDKRKDRPPVVKKEMPIDLLGVTEKI